MMCRDRSVYLSQNPWLDDAVYFVEAISHSVDLHNRLAMESRPPLPPFTFEAAVQKLRAAEDGWNSRDPQKFSMAYTTPSRWRNRAEFTLAELKSSACCRANVYASWTTA